MRTQTEANYVNFFKLQVVCLVQSFQQECQLLADEATVRSCAHITEYREKNIIKRAADYLEP